jgi:hypothetical protein
MMNWLSPDANWRGVAASGPRIDERWPTIRESEGCFWPIFACSHEEAR